MTERVSRIYSCIAKVSFMDSGDIYFLPSPPLIEQTSEDCIYRRSIVTIRF